jgi:hypothetical protein
MILKNLQGLWTQSREKTNAAGRVVSRGAADGLAVMSQRQLWPIVLRQILLAIAHAGTQIFINLIEETGRRQPTLIGTD